MNPSMKSISAYLAIIVGISHTSLALISDTPSSRSLREAAERCVEELITSIKEYPYLVTVQSEDYPTCSGVIVSDNQILTSEQCTRTWPVVPLSVRIGCSNPVMGGSIIPVSHVVPHYTAYVGQNGYSADLALLVLKTSISSDYFAKVADLNWDANLTEETEAELVGWGSSPGISSSFGVLGALKMIIEPNIKCAEWYDKDIPRDLICASSNGIPMCQGDVGGPLIVGKQVVGILSWGDCYKPGYPQVFVSIAAYSEWIKEEIRFEKYFR